ncbi:TauD/TfdA family dioxygenase [Jeongeupia sp. USM3]|uniref:TauD/TfdA dioxygenase family protein n=1 Tax=Jeongeupia sp. USM3 TaxID=1906741 RepID=UPI00089DE358|nr:TauD/TfdA family dioxygenase [Jeongeupia sp. USM3]AOX99970.1 taurine dioxygenase [Jeongeupia sp. USM3]
MTAVPPLTSQLSRAFHALNATGRPDAIQPPGEITIRKNDGALGAIVEGLDANRPQAAETLLRLKQAQHEHFILIFKGQQLSEEALLTFATYFGSVFNPPEDVPVLASADGGRTPDVVLVSNAPGGYTGNGELTPHADHQWTPIPSAGSLLYAVELPSSGGDTSFYNIHQAYEDLDAETRAQIAGLQHITYNPFLRIVDNARRAQRGQPPEWPAYRTPDREPLGPGFAAPLVRTHPDSGKKVLWLSTHTEDEVLGIDPAEGEALIARLRAHIQQPQYRYEHKWTLGDIVFWDNRATLHSRTAFPDTERRVLKRVSLAGSRPF